MNIRYKQFSTVLNRNWKYQYELTTYVLSSKQQSYFLALNIEKA